MRSGIGYDTHPLTEGKKLVLGGVEIPFEKGLDGWSDADVLVHAIIDALFGAAALGDIGKHFPPGDEKYRGISSLSLLEQAREILADAGYRINNIDSTIIAHRPKLSPYITEMRTSLSDALGIDAEQISVKASTSNGLGFIGREEGITALAIATIEGGNNENL